jgi:hypothetical protein
MRWDRYIRWKKWFAWYPVDVHCPGAAAGEKRVWLETVERRELVASTSYAHGFLYRFVGSDWDV